MKFILTLYLTYGLTLSAFAMDCSSLLDNNLHVPCGAAEKESTIIDGCKKGESNYRAAAQEAFNACKALADQTAKMKANAPNCGPQSTSQNCVSQPTAELSQKLAQSIVNLQKNAKIAEDAAQTVANGKDLGVVAYSTYKSTHGVPESTVTKDSDKFDDAVNDGAKEKPQFQSKLISDQFDTYTGIHKSITQINGAIDKLKQMQGEFSSISSKTASNDKNSATMNPTSTAAATNTDGKTAENAGGSGGGGSGGGGSGSGSGSGADQGASQVAGGSTQNGGTSPTPSAGASSPSSGGSAPAGAGSGANNIGPAPAGGGSLAPPGGVFGSTAGNPVPTKNNPKNGSSNSSLPPTSGGASPTGSYNPASGAAAGSGGGSSAGLGGSASGPAKPDGDPANRAPASAQKGLDMAGGGGGGGGDPSGPSLPGDDVLTPFAKSLSDPKFSLAGSDTDGAVKDMVGALSENLGDRASSPADASASGIAGRDGTDLFKRLHSSLERCQRKGCVAGSVQRRLGGGV